MRKLKLSIIGLFFCVICCGYVSAQISTSEQQFLDEYKTNQEETKINIAVAKINWIRNNFIIEELKSNPSKFLRDCSLSYSITAAYMGDDLDEVQREEALLLSLIHI